MGQAFSSSEAASEPSASEREVGYHVDDLMRTTDRQVNYSAPAPTIQVDI